MDENEAKRISEEKGLPLDYVKSMLEFVERTAGNAIDATLVEPPKPRPIPETTALF